MRRVLIIVDPQNDFITGSLAVPGAFKAMTDLANALELYPNYYHKIYVTHDWHPANHCSFKDNGGQWPAHCIADTEGAKVFKALNKALNKCSNVINIYKGADKDLEEYGAPIRPEIIEDVDMFEICGIAEDYCVNETYLNLITALNRNMIEEPEKLIKYIPEFSARISDNPELPIRNINKNI